MLFARYAIRVAEKKKIPHSSCLEVFVDRRFPIQLHHVIENLKIR